jgi:hypothetical protein
MKECTFFTYGCQVQINGSHVMKECTCTLFTYGCQVQINGSHAGCVPPFSKICKAKVTGVHNFIRILSNGCNYSNLGTSRGLCPH